MRFPADAQIAFEPLISQLVVTLTPDQFPQFEEILAKINVAPRQVEIEARFVEVLQRDLEQLGFEWILNDDAELLVRSGPGPVASRERIQIDRNTSGLTSGLRFFNFDGVSNSTAPVSRGGSSQNFLGDILSARGVLTNPELQLVVQALDQKGNSDLLSAPRVTTINGVNAIIQVVNEIIYPTEFDVTENDIQVQGGGGTADDPSQPVFVPPTVIPGGFETREVGVILNVTPTVNPDNYTINLVMLPEIAELVDWIQYGTQVPVGDQIYTVNMPQPVFASRNITTSMIVWDGHTVVMGGLIREDLVTFKDKVPLLGDIPLIGRLFRSEGRKSEKRNLLIFVTARLVDPAGNSQNAETRNQARPNTGLTSSGGTVTTP
jgi:general secretion pathway protein D